jgi:hypothetical protein
MRLVDWLRAACGEYTLEPHAVYRRRGSGPWPLLARDEDELIGKLTSSGHFFPLPTEPAALANVIEVSLAQFLLDRAGAVSDAVARKGTERGYPDLECSGGAFGGGYHAVEIKVARRAAGGKRTQSRITLYTGNTYFMHPQLLWPGSLRPFEDYRSYLDVIAIYTMDLSSLSRIHDLQVVVHEPWRIASRKRSSTTREYIGAVETIADLVAGRGELGSEQEFYSYWRKYPFKIGRAVQQPLDKLLRGRGE